MHDCYKIIEKIESYRERNTHVVEKWGDKRLDHGAVDNVLVSGIGRPVMVVGGGRLGCRYVRFISADDVVAATAAAAVVATVLVSEILAAVSSRHQFRVTLPVPVAILFAIPFLVQRR